MGEKILYSAVVLDEASRLKLLTTLGGEIPTDWKVIAHHTTICFGHGLPRDMKHDLGKTIQLTVTHIGSSDMAIAVVVSGIKTDNAIPHITLAVNDKAGGKPKDSNDIKEWEAIRQIKLTGVISEIKG